MIRAILAICTALAITFTPITELRSDDPTGQPKATPKRQDPEASILTAMDKKISLKLVEVPFRDFAVAISKNIGHPCELDRRALSDVGIGHDVPVTCDLSEMSVRSILNHRLRDLDLTWTIRNGLLLITTPEEAESELTTKVIDVVDLVRVTDWAKEEEFDYDSMIELITTIIEPTTWITVGGPGEINPFRGGLVISQTREVHEQIEQMLNQFRKARQLAKKPVDSPPPVASVDPAHGDPIIAKIQKALAESIVPEFDDMPLEIVARDVGQLRGINVLLDTRALDDVGLETAVPVSFHTGPIPLRDALRHILKQLDLTYVIRDEALVITTPEEAECELVAGAYPVADLLGDVGECDEFGDSRRVASFDDLISLITSAVAPTTWDSVGGPSSISLCAHIDVLVVSQTEDVHQQIADLFGKMRANLAQQGPPDEAPKATSEPAPTRLVVYSVPTTLPESLKKAPSESGKETDKKQSQRSSVTRSTLSQMGMGGGMGGTGRRMGGMGGGMGSAMPANWPVVVPEPELLDLIVELIEPDSWDQREDVYARALPGRLLIRHTDAVHRRIERLLQKLSVHFSTYTPTGPQYGGGFF